MTFSKYLIISSTYQAWHVEGIDLIIYLASDEAEIKSL